MTVPIGDIFNSQYKENKGSKMQEIGIMKKIIHWFKNEVVVKKSYIISTSDFIPFFNR